MPNYFGGAKRSAVYGKNLSEDDIRAIRADERPLAVIGRDYNISAPMVYFIKKRVRWASVE